MKRMIDFLRRHMLTILFSILILGQFLTWRALISIQDNVDRYSCGTYLHPCKTIIVPDR